MALAETLRRPHILRYLSLSLPTNFTATASALALEAAGCELGGISKHTHTHGHTLNTKYLFISSSYLSCALHLFLSLLLLLCVCVCVWHVCAILCFCLCLAGSFQAAFHVHTNVCGCFKCFYCPLLRVKFCHCPALFIALPFTSPLFCV